MAKELPYFKFFTGEWLHGDITMCSMEAQGVFTNLCSYYWNKECSMSLKNAQRRFKDHNGCLDELIDAGVISVNDDDIVIEFLDEQYSEFRSISIKRGKAGEKGGLKGTKWGDDERAKGNQLYVIMLYDKKEDFLKIGVAGESIARRYSTLKEYKLITLYQLFDDECVKYEAELDSLLGGYKYTPKKDFPGRMECYNSKAITKIDDYFKQKRINPKATQKQIESKLKQLREDKEKIRKREDKRRFIAPTVDEVIGYFKENGYMRNIAVKAYNYYNAANWHDGAGKPVLNWKQKMISNWFKDEYKVQKKQTHIEKRETWTPMTQAQMKKMKEEGKL